jgi:hypothetical protein
MNIHIRARAVYPLALFLKYTARPTHLMGRIEPEPGGDSFGPVGLVKLPNGGFGVTPFGDDPNIPRPLPYAPAPDVAPAPMPRANDTQEFPPSVPPPAAVPAVPEPKPVYQPSLGAYAPPGGYYYAAPTEIMEAGKSAPAAPPDAAVQEKLSGVFEFIKKYLAWIVGAVLLIIIIALLSGSGKAIVK